MEKYQSKEHDSTACLPKAAHVQEGEISAGEYMNNDHIGSIMEHIKKAGKGRSRQRKLRYNKLVEGKNNG